jgi:hypothetical protein
MPPRKRKVKLPDGREVEATVLPFQAGGEHWNEYLVDDGTVVRMKLVVTEILRLEGEYDREGNPGYLVNSQNVVNVSAPDELRRGD